ncbi:DUF747-domain-containing protein [Hesseltinella vesiculosa]|uniref:DUF747-domain-containing protein n=1 Tax=Hesseltinella vesiculosa TaxID=101127 RepID=A0A1X2GDD4_9FUNG|nr:DUF747-domain-containing protein [Hesseltinella vesiculosa]
MNYEKLKSSSKPIRSSSVPSSPIHSPNSFQLLERPTPSVSLPSLKKKKRQNRKQTATYWLDSDQCVPTSSRKLIQPSHLSQPIIDASPQQYGAFPPPPPSVSQSPLTLPPVCSPPLSPDPTSPSTASTWVQHMPSMSFWDYLRDELTVSDFDSTQEIKRERITNFLAVPGSLEKLMGFGFVVCLDSFLYMFTILPLRFGLALYHYLWTIYVNLQVLWYGQGEFLRLRASQKCDLLKGLLIISTCVAMATLDPSRLYHAIRGQAVLKLYVIFNVLEICDKLCCSVGVDILDALFSKSTLGSSPHHESGTATDYARRHLKPVTLFMLAAIYMLIHTAVLFFEMITLNVAINFYSNALLSLLISNQFVEIKQSVFKKFERENLFQLSCSDIVERFQQSVFLTIITLRNVVELSDSSPTSVLPSTFVPLFQLPASISINSLMTPVLMVIASELTVDWLKHAFISKFNQIRPSIYEKYIDILCRDLVVGNPGRMSSSKKKNSFVDQSPVVSRRIGFPALPLACMVGFMLPFFELYHPNSSFFAIRMMQQLLPMIFMPSRFDDGPSGTSEPATSVASTLVHGLLSYLADHQGIVSRLLPARIQLVILSLVQCGWLERGLDHFVRGLTWTFFVLFLAIM